MIDVSNKKCVCGKTQPRYNYEGEKPKYCSECKLDNMINLVEKKCFCGKKW
jgi:hypothetical protein